MGNLENLLNVNCSAMYLTHNAEHSVNYVSAKTWIEEYDPRGFESVPADELQKMKDTNSIWCLQIYPSTPVSSYAWYAATLEGVLIAAKEFFDQRELEVM